MTIPELLLTLLPLVAGHAPSASERALDRDMANFIHQAYAPNTRSAYATHRRSYLAFCQVMGYTPVPASSSTLCRCSGPHFEIPQRQTISPYSKNPSFRVGAGCSTGGRLLPPMHSTWHTTKPWRGLKPQGPTYSRIAYPDTVKTWPQPLRRRCLLGLFATHVFRHVACQQCPLQSHFLRPFTPPHSQWPTFPPQGHGPRRQIYQNYPIPRSPSNLPIPEVNSWHCSVPYQGRGAILSPFPAPAP